MGINLQTIPRQNHPYHLVDGSPWPLLMSQAVQSLAISIVSMLVKKNGEVLIPSQVGILIISIQWWRDVIREAKGGYHTTLVQRGILIGFLLFLLSEIMLFVSLFWGFFHSSLVPAIEQGAIWPPVGVNSVNPWALPLQGTCVLQSSGFVVTLSHHATIAGNKDLAIVSLFFTVLLGALFVYLQANEYYYSEFTISDSVYGTVFYITTGAHGLHVIQGVLFLGVGLVRLYLDSFTTEHHIGQEFAIYYWHLVDVVWIGLYLIFYVWGGEVL